MLFVKDTTSRHLALLLANSFNTVLEQQWILPKACIPSNAITQNLQCFWGEITLRMKYHISYEHAKILMDYKKKDNGKVVIKPA